MSDGQKDGTISPELLKTILRKEFPENSTMAMRLEGGWLLDLYTGRTYSANPIPGSDWEVQMTSFQGPNGEQITQPMVVLCPDVLANEDGDRIVGSITVQMRRDGQIRFGAYLGPTGPFLDVMRHPDSPEQKLPSVMIGCVDIDRMLIDGTLAVYHAWVDFPDDEAIEVVEFLEDSAAGSATQIAVAMAYAVAFPGTAMLSPTQAEVAAAYSVAFPGQDGHNESGDDVDDELP